MPTVLRVSGKSSKVDGVYLHDPQRQEKDLPTWCKGGDHPMTLYTDKEGRWAVTSPENVAEGRNFMISKTHDGTWPHLIKAWGKERNGWLEDNPMIKVSSEESAEEDLEVDSFHVAGNCCKCNATFWSSSLRHGCRACNYDVCNTCSQVRLSRCSVLGLGPGLGLGLGFGFGLGLRSGLGLGSE